MQQPRILIVDSKEPCGVPYARLVARLQPLELKIERTIPDARDTLSRDPWDVVIVTLRTKPDKALVYELLETADPHVPIIVVDVHPSITTVRSCLQAGAGDYIDFAHIETDLEDSLNRVLVSTRRKAAQQVLRRAVEKPYSFDDLLGTSPAMKKVYSVIDQVAGSAVDVLITGETGTGKELVARSIHRRSRRAEGPFVPVDCGAIPDALLESELFGHEKGAFTGADSRRMGLIECADGGTLFLDEVGELTVAVQAKLLRVLQERRVRKVGARQENTVDVRVVAATSRDIDGMVAREEFRRDLFYRINVVRIDLPPLRVRGDDIGLLAESFVHRAAQEMGRGEGGLSSDAYQVLKGYQWPGNVRELQNAIRRAVAMTRSKTVGVEDLPDDIVASAGKIMSGDAARGQEASFFAQRARHVSEFECTYLTDLLERFSGDVSAAARSAGIPRGTLYRLMKSHGLDGAAFRK
ncbi:MAG: sigma-54 dependent transcriptional regulator [Pirellulales bacterium]